MVLAKECFEEGREGIIIKERFKKTVFKDSFHTTIYDL
jgi:hypothetical protein